MSKKVSTPRAIDALKPSTDGKRYRQLITAKGIASGSLLIVVSPKGKKTFYTRACSDGKRIDIRLGNYPALSLKEAINDHNECMALIEKGLDPRRVKAAKKAKNQNELTMDELFEQWFKHISKTGAQKNSTIEAHRWRWYSYLSPTLGSLLLNSITRATLLNALDKCVHRSKEQTRKAFTTLNLPLDYALARMMISENPCRTIKPKDVNATKGKPRSRFLSIAEIKELLELLNDCECRHSPQMITLIRLALITGARRSELSNMKWSDLIIKDGYWVWNLPETKNGKPHRIYLFQYAITLLERLGKITGGSTWVFESNIRQGKPIRPDAVTQMIGRLNSESDLEHFTFHDLRRTAATHWVEQVGADSSLVELMLNHLPQNQLVRTYQVITREAEQKDAWQCWGDFLLDLSKSNAS